MWKKQMFIFTLFKIFLIADICGFNVYALSKDDYIVNENGVMVTSKEYEFINEFYNDDYFQNMTQEDYEWIDDLQINTREVHISSYYDDGMQTFSTSHSTASKKITIAKSCTTQYCTIVTNVSWLRNPKIRSYDVIGVRFKDTSLYGTTINTRVSSSEGTESFQNLKKLSNGFGSSVKLPASATSITIQQKFSVNTGGTVFASYQHATKNISLSDSQLYSISSSGYGSVFSFYGNAQNVYDAMQGVYI